MTRTFILCVTLVVTLLIPEAVSATSPTPLAEGFIRFENGAPVEYLVSGDSSQLPDLVTLKRLETLMVPSNPAMTPAARGDSEAVLLKKKFVSKRKLRRTGNLRRVAGTASTSSTGQCNISGRCWDIRYIRLEGRPWYVIPAYTVEGGPGPSTIRFTISTEVRNGYSTKLGLSNELVSAEFGYNVSSAWIAEWENETPIPADKCRRVRTGSYYQAEKGYVYSYLRGLKKSMKYVGWVRAWYFDGYGFKVYKVSCS